MITSRAYNLLRNVNFLRNNAKLQGVRNGHHWSYRSADHHQPKFLTTAAEGITAFMWWWVLWHLWTEPGHVLGEFDYPVASEWTDAELGIPED